MVIVIWEQWKDNIFTQFSTLYNENILTDVCIQVGRKKCDVHSFVISMFSQLFQDLLEIARKENEGETPVNIIFADLTFEAVKTIISFMYFGEMTVEDHLVPEVLYLSRLLQIRGLEDLQAYFSGSVTTDTRLPSDCIENTKYICDVDMIFEEHSAVQEVLMTKKILADIIPLGKLPTEGDGQEPHREEADSDFGEEMNVICSDARGKEGRKIGKRPRGKHAQTKCNKRVKRVLRRKLSSGQECVQEMLRTDVMKQRLLTEVERCLTETTKETWPLDDLGIKLLHEMNETFCGKLKINKGSELLDDTRNPIKISKNRIRREMSYFWHQLLALSDEERKRFVMNIPERAVSDVYKFLLQDKTVIDILKDLMMNTAEMTCCIFILLVVGHLSVTRVTEAYKVDDTYLLYKERIEKAISLYQNTDLFLTDITEQCWVPYTSVKEEIEKLDIKRIDQFDAAIQNALRLCGEGLPVNEVLSSENVSQYSEDFKRILEHHMGRDIVLPLRPYEERIRLALTAAWEQKSMSMAKAAREFIVSYATLCKRALAKEDKDSDFTPKLPSERKRTKLFYRGKTEPVISSGSTRRGQKSKTDKLIRAALLSCKEGMIPEEAFQLYNIKNSRTQNMIKFNVNRKDAPLDQNYTTRFKNAIDEVNISRKTINEASKLHLINYSALREWFYIKNTNRKIPKASAKNRKKPRFEEQIEAAINSVRSGMSVAEAFHKHGMRDKKNLNILKYNANREDAPLHIDYETRLNMAIRAVRNLEMSSTDAGKEYCVNSSTLRYYELQGFKVPSKGPHNFEEQMRSAILACREGMSVRDACAKFNIKTPKYQKILEFNLQREDPPLDEPYANRMQKAKETILNAEMTISEAADIFMVSPAVLSKHFNRAKKSNTIPKPLKFYDSLSNKFDARLIAAIKCCHQGMSIGMSFKQNRLRSERSLECLEYNAQRKDAPLDVTYEKRVKAAVDAVKKAEMKIQLASRHFIVSPFTLEKLCKEVKEPDTAKETYGRILKEESEETETITVIPQSDDSLDIPMNYDVKQETEEDFRIEVFREMDADEKVVIDNIDEDGHDPQNGRDDDHAFFPSGDQLNDHSPRRDNTDKEIKIQILRRYNKSDLEGNSAAGNTRLTNWSHDGTDVSPTATLVSSTKKKLHKSWSERKRSIPVTAYQQRLQLALEACLTRKMKRGEAARRFQVNLGELNDYLEEEGIVA